MQPAYGRSTQLHGIGHPTTLALLTILVHEADRLADLRGHVLSVEGWLLLVKGLVDGKVDREIFNPLVEVVVETGVAHADVVVHSRGELETVVLADCRQG